MARAEGSEAGEDRLQGEIDKLHQGGPEKYRAALKNEGKLFVRDRLKLFFPGGPRFEDGLFANTLKPELPADGMITGAGEIDDRWVFFMANDYTVKAGSMAEKGVEKFLRVQERALKARRPILYLMDSSGARITDQSGFFANLRGIGKYYYNHSLLSGVIPQISVLYGPCIAGAAYTPVFSDFLVMVRGMSAMAIASPRMVAMVTGEEIDMQTLGGADVHAQESGSCHLIAEDEDHAAQLVGQLLSYLPDHFDQAPPRYESRAPASDASIETLVPSDPNKPFDMRKLVEALVDGESLLELGPDHAPEIFTAFCRLGGRVVGIVANNSSKKAGAIFPESADKAAEFITKCDAFNIPLLYLCDTPGFMVGSEVEKQGILKRGKKFIYATSVATVPKLSVVVRKAYGAGLYAMCGIAYEPEAVLALPGAEIAVMGPEAAVNAVFYRHIEAITDPKERATYIEQQRAQYEKDIDIHVMADHLIVDHIVPPSELRKELIARFDAYSRKEETLPRRKHGTVI